MANDAIDGLVVSITGAGRGIGQGLALAFARRGARLVVSDIDADKAQDTASRVRAEGARVAALQVDVRSATDNAAQAEAAIREFGRLDVTLCNAGIAQVKPLLDLEAADWDRMLGINVTGAFLTLQAAARQMLTRRRHWLQVVHRARSSCSHPSPDGQAPRASHRCSRGSARARRR